MSLPLSRQTLTRPPAGRFQLPSLGGTLKIELQTTPGPIRKPRARVLAELQDRAKLGARRPSDTVEGTRWNVVWEPAPRALGIALTAEGTMSAPDGLFVVRESRSCAIVQGLTVRAGRTKP